MHATQPAPGSAHRPSPLPWILLTVVLLGIGVYAFREPLVGLLARTGASSPAGLTTGGVLKSIQDLNNLETVAFTYQVVVPQEQEGTAWKLWLDKQKALFIADGTVSAGVNLDRLTASDVRVSDDGTVVRINLPAAQLLDVNVKQLQTYDFKTQLFGLVPADPELHDAALTSARARLQKIACASDILDMATTNAKRSVEHLFALMDVEVLVEARPSQACPTETIP